MKHFKLIILSLLFPLSLLWATPTLSYPDKWWEPVNDPQKPSWEILPQEADRNKKEVILSKRNELGILSNFAATPFTLKGKKYASLEGLWQCLKYPEDNKDERAQRFTKWPFKRNEVEQMVAFEALRAGKKANEIMKELKIQWVSFHNQKIDYKGKEIEKHYEIIEAAARAKIDQNPEVKKVLLSTGDLILKPDHHEDKDSTKAWRYYDIYMKLRQELFSKGENTNLLPKEWN